jgi:hypothetical protein
MWGGVALDLVLDALEREVGRIRSGLRLQRWAGALGHEHMFVSYRAARTENQRS